MLRRLLAKTRERLMRRRTAVAAATAGGGHWLRPVLAAAACILAAAGILFMSGTMSSAPRGAPPAGGPANAAPAAQPAEKRVPAPSLDGGVAWLNTDNPIKLEDLRGRIVILDFWTLCCINCIHTLPDLAKLEAKYPGILVVLGIHTPKFPNEAFTDSIRKAILRYEVKHPVVNDAKQIIWRRYRVNSWPTLVLIDPEGNLVGHTSGEGKYDVLDENIARLVKEYRAKKMLKEGKIEFKLVQEKRGPLFFPGKVVADGSARLPRAPGKEADKGRLFIADSTHHRIVITDLQGNKIAIAGSGKEGNKNGDFADAQFSDPQGMALDGDTLYVADRKNHQIRTLDLKKHTVETVAGTGKQGYDRDRGGAALKVGLNSPWDLLLHGGDLYVAMAGNHQIWKLDLARKRIQPFAGNGGEDLADGSRAEASFAQPSGLASDGKNLFVADSETSSIRAIPFDPRSEVSTIVGEGLFEFGDEEGVGNKVRLQHALGVAYRDGKLYVADTYNSKIKLLDPNKRSCSTWLGERGGWLNGRTFDEPGGLSFAGDKLYVADTNAHRIRVVDLKTRAVTTLRLQGVEPPPRAKEASKEPKKTE